MTHKERARFWAKVDKSGGESACWLWTGSTAAGYGRIWQRGKAHQAHRVSWYEHKCDPGDLLVLHKCDNPPCVNPSHLFLGTHATNRADMVRKGRENLGGRGKGSQHARAKLTEALIVSILRSSKSGTVLAKVHGVSPTTIRDIRARRTWQHVHDRWQPPARIVPTDGRFFGRGLGAAAEAIYSATPAHPMEGA